MPSVLITGCDTGLGREFAIQYARAGFTVWATYADPANAIGDERIRHHALDVTDFAQFAALKQAVGDAPVDLLISNAGIGRDTGQLGMLDFDYVHRMLAVNTVGPLKLVETFADNVAASRLRRIVLVTSRMGSIESNLSGGHYGYRASKAALNAIGRSLALDLFPRGITVALIHPGWVATAGGGSDAPLTAQQSVQAMRDTIAKLGNHETGVYLTHDGRLLPW
ncbi:MAG TPA: SDR family oxidoreductase [Burkholderiaceae bacterium]|jgi:NAD(P)-dependent dehydrogenase (short-subunit alcohol dehydrogenase family)|nr:SDR family oxidoreductase [Burkholderiaceae bacterium]